MRRRTAVVVVAALAVPALLATPLSDANLPRSTVPEIVRFEHIGGVKIGMGKRKVKRLWGVPDYCDTPNNGTVSCYWFQRGTSDYPPQHAIVELHRGNVCWVRIMAGINRDGGLTITRFRRWRTNKGIGLGSYIRAVRRAYGGIQGSRRGTTFSFFNGYRGPSLKKVAEISMRGPGPCDTT